MKIIVGDLWDELGKADVILVTTNSYVNKKGELVMGRGAAKDAAERFPDLPNKLGTFLENEFNGKLGCYGIKLTAPKDCSFLVGAFQVKYHFKDKADLNLIRHSTATLTLRALVNLNIRYVMNFPGIGFGGRTENEVLPILQILPDNVYIYKK